MFISGGVLYYVGASRDHNQLLGGSGKESTFQCRRLEFHPWVRKIPWRRRWQPTPVFLPGEFCGQSSLAGCSPWGHRESDKS